MVYVLQGGHINISPSGLFRVPDTLAVCAKQRSIGVRLGKACDHRSVFIFEMMMAVPNIHCFGTSSWSPVVEHLSIKQRNLQSLSSRKCGRKLACTPETATSQGVDSQESADDRISRLVAVNERLLARIADLESTLTEAKAKGVATINHMNGVSDGLSTLDVDIPADQGSQQEEVEKAQSQNPLQEVPCSQGLSGFLPKIANIVWPSPEDEVPFWKQNIPKQGDSEAVAVGVSSTKGVSLDKDLAYIIHVTSEMAPLAKVGGLGDVVTGLARACLERGHKVEVMLPFYEIISKDQIEGLVAADSYSSYHRGGWVPIQIYRGKVLGVPVLFVEPNNHFFKGSQIYGGSYDELEAYLFFSRASLEWMQITGTQPDIIHIHEWQISGLAMLYWDMYHHLSLKRPRIVLTIHNMEHYGECRVEQLDMCGLKGLDYRTADKAVDERTIGHNPERLSLLKGGIVYSNAVTTVSPTYANETLCSGWLASTLMKHRNKYSGILNGIDTVLWDPAKDPHLPVNFEAKDLTGKQICKQYIQRGLGLELDRLPTDSLGYAEIQRSPLVVCITRLVAQKGIHLIRHAIFRISELGGQFVLLGTSPDARVQAEFEHLANHFKENKKVSLLLTYSEELAHMLYAAADIVLVPSMFEPCGLTQLIGMRYGAIPVVRKTGGLADTVVDVDDQSKQDNAKGFVFDGIDEGSLNSALDRALRYYQQSGGGCVSTMCFRVPYAILLSSLQSIETSGSLDSLLLSRPDFWLGLASRVMEVDNSWNKSAGQYVSLYSSVRVR